MSHPITVAELGNKLGISVREVSLHVSALCREHGPAKIVHTAQSSNARTILHGTAADLIRARHNAPKGQS